MDTVSILVRTCGRPDILKECLYSIKKQTYPAIEVVVVEDGEALSKEMIEQEFSEMNIRYYYTGQKSGRSKAGNLAIRMATGKYLNFLDDDDCFYENHVETLVNTLHKTGQKVAYSVAHEVRVFYCSHLKRFIEFRKKVQYQEPFNLLHLSLENYFPIQSVMFSADMPKKYDGFNEQMEYLEDWDLWMRYACYEAFAFESQITSKYRVPLFGHKRKKRLVLAKTQLLNEFKKYSMSINVNQSHNELVYILEKLKTPKWKRIIKKYLKNNNLM